MLENNIYSESKALFLQELEAGNVPEDAVVYIEDTKEIYTHGTYFASGDDYVSQADFNSTYGIIQESFNAKQNLLKSGENIKTINGESILGEGNIVISGGSNSSGGTYALVEHDTNDTTYTLTPNTFHTWGEVGSLTLTFGEEQSGVANEFLFQFESGETATTLTLPDNLIWANDDTPVIESNYTYQVSILKGFATLMKFKKAVLQEFTITVYEGFMNTRYETYSYKTGMTWGQWVNSEYNTNGDYKINNDGCIYNDVANVMSGIVYYSTANGSIEITESDVIDNTIKYAIE